MNSTVNRFRKLKTLYVFLMLVIPAFFLLYGLSIEQGFAMNSFTGQAVRYIFVFLNLPVYCVYTYKLVTDFFPEKLFNVLLLFLPFCLLVILNYQMFTEMKEFFDTMLTFSLPFFLGVSICYVMGFVILFATNTVPATVFVIYIALLILVSLPIAHFYMIGLYFLEPTQEDFIQYIFSIALVIVFQFPLLVKLYKQGSL